jgi:acyl carrier protein
MISDTEERLRGVLEAVLGPTGRTLADHDGPGTVPAWDSVAHLNLILAVETEFDIRFETWEIPQLLSLGSLRHRLSGR